MENICNKVIEPTQENSFDSVDEFNGMGDESNQFTEEEQEVIKLLNITVELQ